MKQISIDINETVESEYEMVELLRLIQEKIGEGFTSGIDPTWSLTIDEIEK